MLSTWVQDQRGDMAEKAVVMFAIIIAAATAYQFLGSAIAGVVNSVAGSI